MNKRNMVLFYLLVILILSILISCSTVPEIRVTYRLPGETSDLSHTNVFLDFDDQRTRENIIGENARKEYKGFPGNFTMYLSDDAGESIKTGILDIKSLFLKTMKMRLENQGMIIVEKESMSANKLIIVLKEFSIDLIERKWVVRISYEARISINGKERAKQMINAQGERLKLLNHKQADILMSDIFTDSINRLNVLSLMKEVGLK